MRSASGSVAACLLAVLCARDATAQDVSELDLDSLLEQTVVSGTKSTLSGAQTPAVVTVVKGEDLRARGYQTLADVLRTVPGVYSVFDLVTHNVGIRGINGGARASGNVLKLMVDGHPVDYRPTTGNFFGAELIPLQVIERIEIVRGPASALYGANAFLGVVNVITRDAESIAGVHLDGSARLLRNHPGAGFGATVAASVPGAELLLGFSGAVQDRSGLALPDTSPALDRAFNPAPDEPSQNDLSRPRSFFARGEAKLPVGKLSLWASVQRLDAAGEFQDFAPLTHGTRISLLNQNYRALYEVSPVESLALELSGFAFFAAPTGKEVLDIGRPDHVLLRSSGASGFGGSAEARWTATERLALTFGVDFVHEDHLLQAFDQLLTQDVVVPGGGVVRTKGTLIPGAGHGERRAFDNIGALAQGMLQLGDAFTAVAGARVDYHNIYGINPSGRLGIVFAPPERGLSLKALYGSSFKAPSAVQLYTQPMTVGDIQGNPNLRSQTAHTVELASTFLPISMLELSVNLFATEVLGRVEFRRQGLFLQAQNSGSERVLGGELEARLRPSAPLSFKLSGGVARTVAQDTGTPVLGSLSPQNPLYPLYQVHLLAEYRLPWKGLRLSGEASYVGPRSASQPNALEAGATYSLPAYVYLSGSLALVEERLWGDRLTTLSLRAAGPVGRVLAEPGFGGVDYPMLGFSAGLTWVQQLF